MLHNTEERSIFPGVQNIAKSAVTSITLHRGINYFPLYFIKQTSKKKFK